MSFKTRRLWLQIISALWVNRPFMSLVLSGLKCFKKSRFSDETFIFGVSIIALAGPLPCPFAPSNGHCRLPRKLLSRSFIQCLCNEFVHGPKNSHSLLALLHSALTYLKTDALLTSLATEPILRLEFLECFAHKYLCEARAAVGNQAKSLPC